VSQENNPRVRARSKFQNSWVST